MSKKKNKGRIGGLFVPLLHDMLDCPAYKALSHGARGLYVALKRKAWQNRAYLSRREAMLALGAANHHKIREWYAELEHYGFIEKVTDHCLGVDGKGKSAHWRITELGRTGTVAGELPTKEYLRWDGVLFDPTPYRSTRRKWQEGKIESLGSRAPYPGGHVHHSGVADVPTPNGASVADVPTIQDEGGVADVTHISKLTTMGSPASTPQTLPRIIVAPNDPRMTALDAALGRLKARRSHNEKHG